MEFSAFGVFPRHVCLALMLATTLFFRNSYAAPPGFGAPDSAIVDELDPANLLRIVGKLSGADTIQAGGDTIRIMTRYALGSQIASVRSYLAREIRALGYEPSLQSFVLSVAVPDLTGTAYSASDDLFVVTDAGGTVYRSSGGSDWSRFDKCGSVGALVNDLECDTQGRLWAACRLLGSAAGGLFLSMDGGETWSLRASGTFIYALGTITFEDAQCAMAAGSNGSIIRTIDGGETWSSIDPQSIGSWTLRGSATNGMMRFWFVTDAGALYETPDLGGTWIKRTLTNLPLSGIDFHGENAGVVVGSRAAFYTKNAGATWTEVGVPTEFTAVCMIDSTRVLASGTGGEVWRSEDGGSSWARFGAECTVSADVWSIAAEGGGRFRLAGRDLVRRLTWDGEIRDCEARQFADTIWGRNISFRHEGARGTNELVFLTAHYDSYAGASARDCAPGADDNATGVAAVLECARILRSKRTERSVEFVLFDGEELGLKGSRYFAHHLDTGIVYRGALNLDMLGYDPNEVPTAVISGRAGNAGDTAIAALMASAIDSFGISLETAYVQGNLTSDQLAFWEVGIPAVLLIEGTRLELTPYYHSCYDVLQNLTPDFFETCAKAALGTMALFAGVLPPETAPAGLALHQNYPNPFNAGTVVSYELPAPAMVDVALYDAAGRRVATIARGSREQGKHEERWDGFGDGGRRLSSGVYFVHLKSEIGEATRKLVIMR